MTSIDEIDEIVAECTSLQLLIPGALGEGKFEFTDENGKVIDIFKYVAEHNIMLHKHIQQRVYDLGLKLCQLVKYIEDDDERPIFCHADYKLFAKLLDCVMKLDLDLKKMICFYPIGICMGSEEHNEKYYHVNDPVARAGIEICEALLEHCGFVLEE